MEINALTESVIGLAMEVHKDLGPGLLESVYKAALAYELEQARIPFEVEKGLPVRYQTVVLDMGFRCDCLIDERLIVECKACRELTRLDRAQLLNYLKISDRRVGLLFNFNVLVFKTGIKRMVNNFVG